MNSPSYCLQKMLWQYTYEIYINTLIAIIYFLSKHHLQGGDREQHSKTIALVISIHTTRKVVTKDPRGTIIAKLFQSTPPARWWQQFCTKTTLNSYSSSPTICPQFTLHLTFFHIKKQSQEISHQNSGANPPGISCALQVRTKRSEALSH